MMTYCTVHVKCHDPPSQSQQLNTNDYEVKVSSLYTLSSTLNYLNLFHIILNVIGTINEK